jgi:hypothetical protein
VVREAVAGTDGVRMTVALRVSKSEFEGVKVAFQSAVAAVSGQGVVAVDVVIEDVADKPRDFRGGGTLSASWTFSLLLVTLTRMREMLP